MSGVTVHTFIGSHYEIGFQQGQAVRRMVSQLMQQLPSMETVRLLKPRFLPMSLFILLGKRRATRLLEQDVRRHYPKQAQRLQGIADGAGVDASTLFFMQSMELLVGKPTTATFSVPACTSLGFGPQQMVTREPVIAKNFDYLNEVLPYQLTCQVTPVDRYETLGCTVGALPGMIDGMNEHGLTVTYNYAFTTDAPTCYAPLSMALQEMLETCTTTKEAVHFITHARQGGHDALLMIADATGHLQTVEITANHAATRDPVNGRLINTNHYQTPNLQSYQVRMDAVWRGKVPRGLQGVRVHESSVQRLARLQELLPANGRLDVSQIQTVLRDHGANATPSANTLCRHGPWASTIRSSIFHPQRQTIDVLYGYTCQNQYHDVALK